MCGRAFSEVKREQQLTNNRRLKESNECMYIFIHQTCGRQKSMRKKQAYIYIQQERKNEEKKNSEQMFSYYILHIQLHTMMTDTLPLLW